MRRCLPLPFARQHGIFWREEAGRGALLDRGPKICWAKHGGLSATAAQAALLLVEVPDIQFELFFEIIHPMSAWHTEPVSPLIG
jgi:hypothetical protein